MKKIAFVPALHEQVYSELFRRITTGKWPPGSMVPSEQLLASEMGVSIGTLRKAMAQLEKQALINRVQGRGTFVPDAGDSVQDERFASILGPDGRVVQSSTTVVDVQRVPATPRQLASFGREGEFELIVVRRIRCLGDIPFLFETVTLPGDCFPRFDDAKDPARSIGTIAFRHGVALTGADEYVSTAALPADVAPHLGAETGETVLRLDRQSHGAKGLIETRLAYCILPPGYTYRSKLT